MTFRDASSVRLIACFFAAALVGFALSAAGPVTAHTASTHIPREWTADPSYYFGDINSPLNSATAKQSMHFGDDPWDLNSGTWLDFNWSGVENPMVIWTGNACTTGYGATVWLLTYPISPLAIEATCIGETSILRSVIRFDETRNNWYVGSSSTVPSGQFDLRSVAVHEFGHAGGFSSPENNGHWDGVDEDCTGSDRETMCSATPDGTSYRRSIEEHENHTFDSAY